jgi:hypothetical protein
MKIHSILSIIKWNTLKRRLKEKIMLLKINKIVENEDGSADMDFEVDDEFIEWFKGKEGLKRWSQKRFEKFVFETLKKAAQIKP